MSGCQSCHKLGTSGGELYVNVSPVTVSFAFGQQLSRSKFIGEAHCGVMFYLDALAELSNSHTLVGRERPYRKQGFVLFGRELCFAAQELFAEP